jgi:hypothetical protein
VEKTDQYEDLGIDGMIILKEVLNIKGRGVWIGFIWVGKALIAGCCERGKFNRT